MALRIGTTSKSTTLVDDHGLAGCFEMAGWCGVGAFSDGWDRPDGDFEDSRGSSREGATFLVWRIDCLPSGSESVS
jgi:hypothetical protein